MNFRKVNNITGWVVFAIASLVYILTAEKAGSLWDCGEFVSAAYKVQMPHPPGAPLFVLLGRFFIILFGDNPATAAKAVNIMNALASGATILFLFWTITHFARKLVTGFREEPNREQIYTIMGAGVVGALAYTFTDSFWFSAVEGEVYALSSLFTGMAFWAMLKWERADDAAGNDRVLKNRADRWIVFLFFSLGLSIGIHLLGLLVIPAAVMIYYYKRYNYSRNGAIWAFLLGCIIVGVVQVVVIQWSVKLAGNFDIFFVNSFHLPFFSGFVFFFLLLAVLIWLGLRWANRKGWSFLRLGLWCFSFMMLGYSAYITTMERSNANPSIDMNNVDNPMNLVYYLGREQYGSQPILFGPHFLAQPTGVTEGKMRYAKDDSTKSYVEIGRDREPEYDSKDVQIFPRVWDGSNDQGHADYYMSWLQLPVINARQLSIVTNVGDGIVQTQDQNQKPDTYQIPDNFSPRVQRGQVIQPGTPIAVKIPSFADNLNWFFTYQMGFMYWRYFMWNFSGRQNDLQGSGNIRDGNWISGISFIDNLRLGDQSKLPDSIKENKATNKLYLIPFLLGLLGCIFHFLKDRKDWIVTFLLFFFTGIAIVIYLNQAGNQPRERDYAYAGSFYAYAIWIGLAVVAFVRMAREVADRATYKNVMIYGGLATFVVMMMSDWNHWSGGSTLAAIAGAFLFAALTAAITYGVRAAGKTNLRTAALVSTLLCLAAPVIMGAQEWDDHDRSQKTLAPDVAKDYLNSCPPNAILFTFGDNDTYPLWYAQEVEGVRPDIRILNTSLLGIDWYVNQLRYKVNQSAPIDVIWSASQIRGVPYITFQPTGDQNKYYDLLDVMKNVVGKENPIATFPVKHFTVPVDVAAAKASGAALPTDSVGQQIQLDIPEAKSYLSLDQLTMLNILAANNWKRPICFTSPYGEIGFGPYLRQEGMIFRLTPVRQPQQRSMNLNVTDSLLRTAFRYGGATTPGVYFDEENRRHLLTIRQTYGLAAANLADAGRKQEAVNLLEKAEKGILPQNLPYAMVSRFQQHNQIGMLYMEAAYKAGHTVLANKINAAMKKDLTDQKNYYNYLKNEKPDYYPSFQDDDQNADQYLRYLDQIQKTYNPQSTIVTEHPLRKDSGDSNKK
ncbi:MAG: glycosyltransferase family 117 protein [Flavisolibacter sp.]